MLIVKLAWRKHMPGGCILKRPCFCPHNNERASALCPIHWFWPLVRNSTKSGELLFKKIKQYNVNRYIRRALSNIAVPAAERYSSHGFRRGAAQELKETGSPFSIVGSLGQWSGASFKSYVDLSDELCRDLSKLLIHSYTFESDEEGEADFEVPLGFGVILLSGHPYRWTLRCYLGLSLGYSGMCGAQTNLCSFYPYNYQN